MFFSVVHSLIANGPPGPSLFEHFMFMRNAKYNIGGIILNLMDVRTLCSIGCLFLPVLIVDALFIFRLNIAFCAEAVPMPFPRSSNAICFPIVMCALSFKSCEQSKYACRVVHVLKRFTHIFPLFFCS